jgi:hypothetical protein
MNEVSTKLVEHGPCKRAEAPRSQVMPEFATFGISLQPRSLLTCYSGAIIVVWDLLKLVRLQDCKIPNYHAKLQSKICTRIQTKTRYSTKHQTRVVLPVAQDRLAIRRGGRRYQLIQCTSIMKDTRMTTKASLFKLATRSLNSKGVCSLE